MNAEFDIWRLAAGLGLMLMGLEFMKSGAEQSSHRFENLVELKNKNESLHAKLHADIYHEVALDALTELQISTLLNVNRELFSSNQSLLASLADVLLDIESAADYESIPVST